MMMTTTIDDSGEEWEFIFSLLCFFSHFQTILSASTDDWHVSIVDSWNAVWHDGWSGGFCILKLYFLFRLNDFSRSPSDHCCCCRCSTLSSPAVRISISIACSTLSATPSALNERITQHEYFLTVERMKKCYIPLRYEEEKFQLSRQQAEQ